MTIREPALPRGWYPHSAKECVSEIESFVEGFEIPPGDWRSGVAPHAGWYFSGKPAARVIAALARRKPDRVVVYGGHLAGRNAPIVYTEDAWDTPLGGAPMDSAFARELTKRRLAVAADYAFADNTVEIQLPMIRRFFGDTPLIAVHAPASTRAVDLAQAVHDLLVERGLSAVFLGSADLTHYGPNYGFTPKGTGPAAVEWVKKENDKSLIDKALALDAEGLLTDAQSKHNSCSAGAIAAAVAHARVLGVTSGRLIEYYTSYDVAPNSGFVGYAGILF